MSIIAIARVLIFSIISIASVNNVFAQRGLFEGVNIRAATENVINNIKEKQFLPNLTANNPKYIQAFNEIKVVVVDKPRPTALALYAEGTRTIEISASITYLVLLYNEYSLLRNYYGDKINKQCSGYLDHLTDMFRKWRALGKIDYQDDSVTAGRYCGTANLRTDEFVKNYLTLLDDDKSLSAVIGFLLGHEYGHHLLHHLPVTKELEPAIRRKIEIDADSFGSNMLGNYASRMGATLIFDFLAKQQGSSPFAVERLYPAEECRFMFLMSEDTRFWIGVQGPDLKIYLDQHVDIKERIPRIFEFINASLINGVVKSQCDRDYSEQVAASSSINSTNKKTVADCWNESAELSSRYEAVYRSIETLKDDITDVNKRKLVACPKFKELVKLLDGMKTVAKECSTKNSPNLYTEANAELRETFSNIVSGCP